jgi:hypothetical protein
MCFSSCLIQGTRYPFVPKIFMAAKQSRCIRRTGTRYESLTATNAAIPRTEQARSGPYVQSISVRGQSASAFSPRQQTQQRTVCIRERATVYTGREQYLQTDTNCPKTNRSLELSTSAIWVPTAVGPNRDWQRTVRAEVSLRIHFLADEYPSPRLHYFILCPYLTQPPSARRWKNSCRAVRRSSKSCFRRKMSSRNCDGSAPHITRLQN